MRKMMVALVVLAVAGIASADVIRIDVIDLGVPVVAGYGTLPGYTVYQVNVVSLVQGVTPNFFDGAFLGDMLQVGTKTWKAVPPPAKWVYTYSPTRPATTGEDLDVMFGIDSHFKIPAGSETPLGLPTETNDFSLGKEPFWSYYDIGMGASMGGAWGVTGAFQTWEMAQIVIPDGGEVWMTATISVSSGIETPLNILIPEPATMALMGFGGLLALRRRR